MGSLGERFVERFLQAARKGSALDKSVQEYIVGLAIGFNVDSVGTVHGVQRGGSQMCAAKRTEFLLERYGRLPGRVACHLDRHQLVVDRAIRRNRANLRDRYGEATRRRIARDLGPAGQKAGIAQARSDPFRECIAEVLQRLRRQFLGEQLDQQRGHRPSRLLASLANVALVLTPPPFGSRAPASGSPALHAHRHRPSRPAATGCGCGRCRRRARSPRWRRAHPEG